MQIWIVGLVERSTDRLMLVPVNSRDSHTLHGIIAKFVKQGSTIYTDGWKGYLGLSDIGYTHLSVNHTETFKAEYIDYQTGDVIEVHTNTIEGAWKHAKVRTYSLHL